MDATSSEPVPHIAVIGQIGAGKSSLVRALATKLGAVALPERVDEDPFFAGFSETPPRSAFQHTVFFVEQSVRDRHRAQSRGLAAVQERIVDEHVEVFAAEFHARGYLTDDEWGVIRRLGETCASMLRPVDLVVYVEISAAEALRRIETRGRVAERHLTVDYVQALDARYADLVQRWSPDRVLIVDGGEYDFRRIEDVNRIATAARISLCRGDRNANSVTGTTRLGEEHLGPGA